MNRLTRFGVAAAFAAVSAVAFSQAGPGGPPSPEAQAKSAIEARQGLFKLINNQNQAIGAMARNTAPFDAEVVARNAGRIKVLAEMAPELFMRDTREFKTITTRALDSIWASQADFKTKADALASAADAVAVAAKTGDKTATLAAYANVGKTCGSCHDAFRAK